MSLKKPAIEVRVERWKGGRDMGVGKSSSKSGVCYVLLNTDHPMVERLFAEKNTRAIIVLASFLTANERLDRENVVVSAEDDLVHDVSLILESAIRFPSSRSVPRIVRSPDSRSIR